MPTMRLPKNETTKYLEHATAPSITGPWKFIAQDNWAGWGSGVEGNNIVRLDNGTYRIFFDSQGTPFMYAESADLVNWTTAKNVPGIYNIARHGTVINLSTQPPLSGTALVSNAAASTALWRLEEADGGSYFLVPSANLALVADVVSESTQAGGTLNIYARNSKNHQKFKFQTTPLTGLDQAQSNDEKNQVKVLAYPNPFTDELQVEAGALFHYKVFDAIGLCVESGQGSYATNIGGKLIPGMYLVKIEDAEGPRVIKVAKRP